MISDQTVWQTQGFFKRNLLGFKLMEQETAKSDGLGELVQ